MVSAGVGPDVKKNQNEENRADMVYEYGEHGHQNWHHGGLVNAPIFLQQEDSMSPGAAKHLDAAARAFGGTELFQKDVQAQMPDEVGKLDLADAPWEVIPLSDVLYCDPARDHIPDHVLAHHVFTLHVHQHDDSLGRLMTLEFSAEDVAVHDAWVDAICSSLQQQRRSVIDAVDHAPEKRFRQLIKEWVNWFQFPVRSLAQMTIPDMDNPHLQKWYPLAFVMSMAWLAVFAFLVVGVCNGIHDDFGISTVVLGFTVAAAGTSFPNVFSGMVVSRQGKPSMAIANALGANVQNVFIALAIPWSIQCFFVNRGGSFHLYVSDLRPAAVECGLAVLPVLLTFWCCHGTFPRWSGAMYLVVYVIYVIVSLLQESSGCMYWPFDCSQV